MHSTGNHTHGTHAAAPKLQRALQLLPWFAAVALAVEPALWLTNTWRGDFTGQGGPWIALATLGLFLSSATSAGPRASDGDRRLATALLMASALVRLAAQIMAINILGAVTLVLDVYSLGRLFALHRRQRPLAPGWLAILFSLSLPIERVLQRVAGYGLQQLSAAGACTLLKAGSDDVVCSGVRIVLAGQDVQVDLPCSGASGLVIIAALFALLACLGRPKPLHASLGALVALLAAVTSNILRITTLAIGLAFPELFGGVDVMAQPWHDIIGLAALALGTAPLVIWARVSTVERPHVETKTVQSEPRQQARPWTAAIARWAMVPVAVLVFLVPTNPIDVSRTHGAPTLPVSLAGASGAPQPLTNQEHRYFTQYGGGAARSVYGEHALLVVSTSAPLRHLHDPNECLTGAGHEVEFKGVEHAPRPSAVYQTTDPQGKSWRVAVTYVSDAGELATGVSEVALRWLGDRDQTWRAVQRISPWHATNTSRFDAAVWAALDMPHAQNHAQIAYSRAPSLTPYNKHPNNGGNQ